MPAPPDLPEQLTVTRRRLLLDLAIGVPALGLSAPLLVHAQGDGDRFLEASRVITGNATLSAGIASRIMALLVGRMPGFASKLDDLVKSFARSGGGRDQMLSGLTDEQVRFALAIAEPWYMGRVGKPSDFVLKDDAAFATYLEAQSWTKIVAEVPRPTYPGAGAAWWDVAPPGVVPPAMPAAITDWTFHPDGPAQILAPDPTWKTYAVANHASVDAARRAKPGAR